MSILLPLLVVALLAYFLFRARGASTTDLQAFAGRNAQRVDVRSAAEYRSAHAPRTLNIPLDQLSGRLGELDSARPVLVCCASGSRSAMAASLLKGRGFEVLNAGPWTRLEDLP